MKKLVLSVVIAASVLAGGITAAADSYTDTETVKAVQEKLNEAGFDCGAPDGISGSKTVEAIRNFQESNRMETSGEIDDELLAALSIDVSEADKPEQAVSETADEQQAADEASTISVAEAVGNVLMDQEGCKITFAGIDESEQAIELLIEGIDLNDYQSTAYLAIEGVMVSAELEESTNDTFESNYKMLPQIDEMLPVQTTIDQATDLGFQFTFRENEISDNDGVQFYQTISSEMVHYYPFGKEQVKTYQIEESADVTVLANYDSFKISVKPVDAGMVVAVLYVENKSQNILNLYGIEGLLPVDVDIYPGCLYVAAAYDTYVSMYCMENNAEWSQYDEHPSYDLEFSF